MDAGRAAGPRAAAGEPRLSVPALATLSETLHRVGNSLTILSAAIRMERRRVSDPVAGAVLDRAVARLEATAQVHRLIYGLPPEARLDLTGFLGHLAAVIGTSIGMGCGVRGTAVEVSGRTAEGLAVAMTELVLNAYKHGYGGAAGDGVEVRVARAPGGWVRLTVRDWGRGMAEAARPFKADGTGPARTGLTGASLAGTNSAGTGSVGAKPDGVGLDGTGLDGTGLDGSSAQEGLGLRLVASAVETLGGRMTAVTDGGTHVVIEVPEA